jgi:ribosomal protein S25
MNIEKTQADRVKELHQLSSKFLKFNENQVSQFELLFSSMLYSLTGESRSYNQTRNQTMADLCAYFQACNEHVTKVDEAIARKDKKAAEKLLTKEMISITISKSASVLNGVDSSIDKVESVHPSELFAKTNIKFGLARAALARLWWALRPAQRALKAKKRLDQLKAKIASLAASLSGTDNDAVANAFGLTFSQLETECKNAFEKLRSDPAASRHKGSTNCFTRLSQLEKQVKLAGSLVGRITEVTVEVARVEETLNLWLTSPPEYKLPLAENQLAPTCLRKDKWPLVDDSDKSPAKLIAKARELVANAARDIVQTNVDPCEIRLQQAQKLLQQARQYIKDADAAKSAVETVVGNLLPAHSAFVAALAEGVQATKDGVKTYGHDHFAKELELVAEATTLKTLAQKELDAIKQLYDQRQFAQSKTKAAKLLSDVEYMHSRVDRLTKRSAELRAQGVQPKPAKPVASPASPATEPQPTSSGVPTKEAGGRIWLDLSNVQDVDNKLKDLLKNKVKGEAFDFSGSNLTGAGLRQLSTNVGKALALQAINVARTPNGDDELSCLDQFRNCVEINASGTQVTDRFIDVLIQLEKLESIDLSNTAITDKGLRKLQKLTHLKKVKLKGAQTTPAGIQSFKEKSPLCFVLS